MPENVYEQMIAYWSSPEACAVSEQNSRNRRSQGGGSVHTGGPIPHLAHQYRMVSLLFFLSLYSNFNLHYDINLIF